VGDGVDLAAEREGQFKLLLGVGAVAGVEEPPGRAQTGEGLIGQRADLAIQLGGAFEVAAGDGRCRLQPRCRGATWATSSISSAPRPRS
jgi:hypothetical protein